MADTLGRRPVMVIAGTIDIVSLAVLSIADGLPLFLLFFTLQGINRALDSGPLESWYVDSLLDIDPNAPIERGLGGGGVIMGAATGGGALASSALVVLDPFGGLSPLVLPVLVALVPRGAEITAVALLVREGPRGERGGGLRTSVKGVPVWTAATTRPSASTRRPTTPTHRAGRSLYPVRKCPGRALSYRV